MPNLDNLRDIMQYWLDRCKEDQERGRNYASLYISALIDAAILGRIGEEVNVPVYLPKFSDARDIANILDFERNFESRHSRMETLQHALTIDPDNWDALESAREIFFRTMDFSYLKYFCRVRPEYSSELFAFSLDKIHAAFTGLFSDIELPLEFILKLRAENDAFKFEDLPEFAWTRRFLNEPCVS